MLLSLSLSLYYSFYFFSLYSLTLLFDFKVPQVVDLAKYLADLLVIYRANDTDLLAEVNNYYLFLQVLFLYYYFIFLCYLLCYMTEVIKS